MPTSRIAAMSSDVATGRRMNGRDGLTASCPRRTEPRSAPEPAEARSMTVTFAPSCSSSKLLLATTSPGAMPSTCVTPVVAGAGLHCSHVRDLGLDHVDERLRPVLLDGRRRDQRDAVQRVDEQARVDELVREEGVVLVVELGARLHRAGRGVDLVVEREQRAARDLLLRRSGRRRRPRAWLPAPGALAPRPAGPRRS